MVSIGIIITQLGYSGSAGASREDLVLNQPVTLTNSSSAGVTSYKWEIIGKPYTSTATLSSSTASTSVFTPDVEGSYLVQLTLNNKIKQRVVSAILTDRLSIRIPAAGEGEEIVGGSFKAITESIRTLETSTDASKLQGKNISSEAPGANDILTYNGSAWAPSGSVRSDDIGFRNYQDILVKIPLSAAIAANSGWTYSAGVSSLKPCWQSAVDTTLPVLDFSWNMFPHGSTLKKLCVVASCNHMDSNNLVITIDKTGAVWNEISEITSLTEQFISRTDNTVTSTVSDVIEVPLLNTTFTHGNETQGVIASEGLSIRLTADGIHNFKIFAVYVYFQTLSVGLFSGPSIAVGGGTGGGGSTGGGSGGCCPFEIVEVNSNTYGVPADGYNTLYVSNKPVIDDVVVFTLPKATEAGEGANFEFLVTGTYNTGADGKFVLKTDPVDVDGITWIGGDHSSASIGADQEFSKIRLVSDGVTGWYAESGEGFWGSVIYGDDLVWSYTDKFLYTANVDGGVEDNITIFDAYGNIKDSGVAISEVGGTTTASNYGVGGVGVYNDKNANDIRFRSINVGSNKLTVTLDNANHEVDLNVVEANLVHQNISGAGHYTHSVVDSHMDSYSNPHVVTKTQVGLSNVDNFRQVHGISSTTTDHLVSWGVDGYHVKDSGTAISDLQSALTFEHSVQNVASVIDLVGDIHTPAANWFYGTTRTAHGATRGWSTRNIARRLTVGIDGTDGYDVDYHSIGAAVTAAIADGCSATKQWEIIVYPGVYPESPISVPLGINIISHDQRIDTAFVTAVDPNQDLFTMTGGYICGLNVSGVSNGSKCLFRAATAAFNVLHGIAFNNCSNGVIATGGATVIMTNTSMVISGAGQAIGTGIYCSGSGTYIAASGMFASVSATVAAAYYAAANAIGTIIKAYDSGEICVSAGVCRVTSLGASASDVIMSDNSGRVLLSGLEISGSGNALHIGSLGASEIITQSVILNENRKDIVNDSVAGKVFANYSSDIARYDTLTGTQLSGIVQYRDDALVKFIGNVEYQYLDSGKDVAFDRYFAESSSTGVSIGGFVSEGTGLHVNVTEGYGWIRRGADSYDSFDVSWDPEVALDLNDNTTNYIVYNMTNGIERLLSPPNYDVNILLATAITQGGDIRFLHRTRNFLTAPMEQIRDYLLATRKRMMNSGLLVSADTTVPIDSTTFSISGGSYYIGLDLIPGAIPFGDMTDTNFQYYFTNSTADGYTPTNGDEINLTQYDDAGTLVTMDPTDGYRVDTVIITSDQRINVIFGTETYSTLTLAEAAPVGITPSFMEHTSFPLANLIVWGTHGIIEVIDLRAQEIGTGGGGGGTHNDLSGRDSLTAHTQYLLKTGGSGEALSGDLYMGTNDIVNVGTINNISIEDHSTRHLPDSSALDALPTASAASLTVNDTAGPGIANDFSRSDHKHAVPRGVPVSTGVTNAAGSAGTFADSAHVHAHAEYYPNDGVNERLHAIATLSYAGFMSMADKAAVHSELMLASSAVTGGLSLSTQTLSFRKATTLLDGYLCRADWNTFNGKITDPTTLVGDTIYRGIAVPANLSRLPIGTVGKVLRSDGSIPAWYLLEKIVQGDTSAEVIDTGSDGRFVVTTEGVARLTINASGYAGFGTSTFTGTIGGIISKGTTSDNTTNVFVGRSLAAETGTSIITSNGEFRGSALAVGNTAATTAPGSLADFITNTTKQIYIGLSADLGKGLYIGESVTVTTNYMLIGKNLKGGTTTSNYTTPSAIGGYSGIEFMPAGVIRFLSSNASTSAGGIITPPIQEVMRIDGTVANNGTVLIGTVTTGARLVVKAYSTDNIFVGRNSSENNICTLSYNGALTLGQGSVATGSIVLTSIQAGGPTITISVPTSGVTTWPLTLPAVKATSDGHVLTALGTTGATEWRAVSASGATHDLTASGGISLSPNGTGILSTQPVTISITAGDMVAGSNITLTGGTITGRLLNSVLGNVTIATSSTPSFTSTTLTSATTPLMFSNGGFVGTLFWTPSSTWSLKLPSAPPGVTGYVLTSTTLGVTSWELRESPLTFTDGLTITKISNTVRNDFYTGKGSYQTVFGGTISGGSLTLRGTSDAGKGYIYFGIGNGNSVYNEITDVLGLRNYSPSGAPLVIGTEGVYAGSIKIEAATTGYVTLAVPASVPIPYTFIFPANAGTAGQYLISGGGGTLTWGAMAESQNLASVTSFGATTNLACTFAAASPSITLGTPLASTGGISFRSSGTGTLILTVPSATSSWTMTLPSAGAGAANYALKSVSSGGSTTTAWGAINTSELVTSITSGYILTSNGSGIVGIAAPVIHIHDVATENVFVGSGTFNSGTYGPKNTALGFNVLWGSSAGTIGNTGVGCRAMRLTQGSYNTAVGESSMVSDTCSSYNVTIGSKSMFVHAAYTYPAYGNASVGFWSLYNVIGDAIVDDHGRNSALGPYAGASIRTGARNVAIGSFALCSAIATFGVTVPASTCTGSDNIAIGTSTSTTLTSGYSNISIGNEAAKVLTSGNNNIAIGYRSLYACSTSSVNTCVGYNAGSAYTGSNIVAIGGLALYNCTTGAYNTALGYHTLQTTTTGESNTAIGYETLLYADTYININTYSCNGDTAVGYRALRNLAVNGIGSEASLNSGRFNTAVGSSAGQYLTTGYYNTIIGSLAGAFIINLTTGSQNVLIGGGSHTVANSNTDAVSIGYIAIAGNSGTTIGSSATSANGVSVGYSAVSTVSGIAIGTSASGGTGIAIGDSSTAAILSVAIGTSASSTTSSVAIGYGATCGGGNGIAIGRHTSGACISSGNGINIGYYGIVATSGIKIGTYLTHTTATISSASWAYNSDIRLKDEINDSELGINFIKKLRPVSYRMKRYENGIAVRLASRKDLGFIAQELKKIEGMDDFRIVMDPKVKDPNSDEPMSINYNDLMAPMVKAIQEQQAMIEALKVEVATLRSLIK